MDQDLVCQVCKKTIKGYFTRYGQVLYLCSKCFREYVDTQ